MFPAPALLQAGLNAVKDSTEPLDHTVQICRREDSTWGSEVQNTLAEPPPQACQAPQTSCEPRGRGSRQGAAAWRGGPEAGHRQREGNGPGRLATHLSAADCASNLSQ